MKNQGSATVEACLVVPLFLFFLLAIHSVASVFLADSHIHQSLAEASNYVALEGYLEQKCLKEESGGFLNTALLFKKFHDYLGEDAYVEHVVFLGKKGILVTANEEPGNPAVFTVKASYRVWIQLPVLGTFQIPMTDYVRKKTFTGYDKTLEKAEEYVFITPNEEVCHKSRSCTHLSLRIEKKSGRNREHYIPCRFCAKDDAGTGEIYVAKTSGVYHVRKGCSGLKRTVYRVKKTEVPALPICSRCGERGR